MQPRSEQENKKPSIAIVIGSGSVMCAASVGILKVLAEAGISPDMVVGSSGGSLYAALIALGYDGPNLEKMSVNLWTSDLFEGYATNLKSTLIGETRFTENSGLIDDTRMNQRLREVYGESTFADTQIPLYIAATDLYTGEGYALSEGTIFDAVRASIAIPLIFSPWTIGEAKMVDGAVANPLPLDIAIQNGAEVIIAVSFELPTRTRMRSYTAATTHFNALYMNNILKSRFAFYTAVHHSEIILVQPEFDQNISTFDTERVPDIITRGEAAMKQELGYLLRLLGMDF